MKKILLISSLFASAVAFAQSGTLGTSYVGGGTDYYNVTTQNLDFNSSLGSITVSSGTSGNYAGWEGSDIGVTYENKSQTFTALTVESNWTIKNNFIITSASNDWARTSNTKFVVKNGSTLTFSNLVDNNNTHNANQVLFTGIDNANGENSKVVLNLSTTRTSGNQTFGGSGLRLENIDAFYTNSNIKLYQMKLEGNATLNLSSDFVMEYMYVNNKNNRIKLNGCEFNFASSNWNSKNEKNVASELIVDFSNGAGTYIANGLNTGNLAVEMVIENFNYMEDFLVFTNQVDKSLITFVADNGTEYTGNQITEEVWTGGYRYYVDGLIPEPSTYAGIFGVVALGFALYRRRK